MSWLLVLAAVSGCGLGRHPTRTPPTATTNVVVAAKDLPAGRTIALDDVRTVLDVPRARVPEDVAQRASHVYGRHPNSRIFAGEPIRKERLADADEVRGLQALVWRGMRAFALPVPAAVSREVGAGDYVDVLGRVPRSGGVVDCLATNAAYVLLGAEASTGRPFLVLVLVPDQMQEMAWLLAHGTAEVALRNNLDVSATGYGLPKCGPALFAPGPGTSKSRAPGASSSD